MCGFIGVVEFNDCIEEEYLKSQIDILNHRGPDGNGYLINNNENYSYGFVHNRLSIIDTSSKGKQPVSRSHIDMIYNGEVYNYKEIKKELNLDNFLSSSDTEVVLQNILLKGVDAIKDFNGMFSIAYIDKNSHKLFLVRDRLGVKPLYYYNAESAFYFSSEPKGIINQKKFIKKINTTEVHHFFNRGNTSSENTLFDGMKKVPPGSILELDLQTKEIKINNYWKYSNFIKPSKQISRKSFMGSFEEILNDSIELRLRSDVPLGVYLSGGYDSSLVAYKSNSLSKNKINTFCIGFNNSNFDESKYAKDIAKKIGTNHTEFILDKKDIDDNLFNTIDELIDDPIADPSVIPNLILNKLAKEDITVALSGDGGDELFAGYDSYNSSLLHNKITQNNKYLKSGNNFVDNIFNKSFFVKQNRKFSRLISLASSTNSLSFHKEYTSIFPLTDLKNILINHSKNYKHENQLVFDNQILKELLNNDINDSLVNKLLLKTDRTSMQYGVEVREPLLDYRLFELAAQSNPDYFIEKKINKAPIKNLAHKYIGKNLLERPKSGFNIPIKEFCFTFFTENMNLIENNSFTSKQNIFNPDFLNYISKNINSDKLNFRQVFALFIFQRWYSKWFN